MRTKKNKEVEIEPDPWEGLYPEVEVDTINVGKIIDKKVELKKMYPHYRDPDEDEDDFDNEIDGQDEFYFDPAHPEQTKLPPYLGKIARREFDNVVAQYREAGVLNVLDAATLLVYVKCFEKYHQFERNFHTGRYSHSVFSIKGGVYVRTIESTMQQENIRNLSLLGSQLGVNPASRKKMDMKGKTKTKTALEEFMERKQGKK